MMREKTWKWTDSKTKREGEERGESRGGRDVRQRREQKTETESMRTGRRMMVMMVQGAGGKKRKRNRVKLVSPGVLQHSPTITCTRPPFMAVLSPPQKKAKTLITMFYYNSVTIFNMFNCFSIF